MPTPLSASEIIAARNAHRERRKQDIRDWAKTKSDILANVFGTHPPFTGDCLPNIFVDRNLAISLREVIQHLAHLEHTLSVVDDKLARCQIMLPYPPDVQRALQEHLREDFVLLEAERVMDNPEPLETSFQYQEWWEANP